jgi:hypothetical protein
LEQTLRFSVVAVFFSFVRTSWRVPRFPTRPISTPIATKNGAEFDHEYARMMVEGHQGGGRADSGGQTVLELLDAVLENDEIRRPWSTSIVIIEVGEN